MRNAISTIQLALVCVTLILSGCPQRPNQPPPTADFTAQPLSGSAPLTVQFTDRSTTSGTAIRSWMWDFGDGASSQEQNPTHIYQQAGSYTVSLTVSDGTGEDTLVRNNLITAYDGIPAIIREGVVVPEQDETLTVTAVREDQVSLQYNGTSGRPVEQGTILVSGEGNGFLRRVLDVSQTGDTLTANTTPAALTDVFEQADITGSTTFTVEDFLDAGIPLEKSGSTFISLGNVTAGLSDGMSVRYQGGVDFAPSADFDLRVQDNSVEYFKFTATGRLYVDFNILLEATRETSISYSRSLFDLLGVRKPSKPIYIQAGWVPVVVILEFDVMLGGSVSSRQASSFTSGFDSTTNIVIGAEYTGTQWRNLSAVTLSPNLHPPVWTIEEEFSGRFYLEPTVSAKLYALTGPSAAVQPYAALTVRTLPRPLRATLDAGIDGSLGFDLINLSAIGTDFAVGFSLGFEGPRRQIWSYTAEELVMTPNVVGQSETAARAAITGARLTVGTITMEASDSVPAGQVISQNPASGTEVPLATAVDLVVSSGPAQVTVPNVVGQTESAASAAISDAGLVAGSITQQESDSVPAGQVISQNPSAGSQAAPGSQVNLVVSSGPAPVAVPNVVGQTEAAALAAIDGAGLVGGTIARQASDSVPAGQVISQSPGAGTQVAPGSPVNLVISSGPQEPPAGSGTVSGRVTEAGSENPIQGASVELRALGSVTGAPFATATTDGNGQYALTNLAAGGATILFTKSGYLSTSQNVTVVSEESTQVSPALVVADTGESSGVASGKVIDAVTGNGIDAVQLDLRAGILRQGDTSSPVVASVMTNASGSYVFEELNAGVYTAFAAKTGYVAGVFTVYCVGGQTSPNQDGSLSPSVAEGEIRIVLEWGEHPRDLDSHLTGPRASGDGRFHIYFSNRTELGHADLDRDDTTSFGPETTTIRARHPGVYRFSVHDYTNRSSTTSSAMSNSGAKVRVTTSAGIREFNIRPNTPATLWTVLEIDGQSGVITEVDTYSFVSAPGSVTKGTGEAADREDHESPWLFTFLPDKEQ